jgi:hypothetical protein
MEETILAYLASTLTTRYEDLVTKALCYLLNKYPLVAQSFCSYIAKSGMSLPSGLKFKTWAMGPDERIKMGVLFSSSSPSFGLV